MSVRSLPGQLLLDVLLRDGRAALDGLALGVGDERPEDRRRVDARVGEELPVLGGEQGVDHRRGHGVEGHQHPVLGVEGREGRQLGPRCVQEEGGLDRRPDGRQRHLRQHIAEARDGRDGEQHDREHDPAQPPDHRALAGSAAQGPWQRLPEGEAVTPPLRSRAAAATSSAVTAPPLPAVDQARPATAAVRACRRPWSGSRRAGGWTPADARVASSGGRPAQRHDRGPAGRRGSPGGRGPGRRRAAVPLHPGRPGSWRRRCCRGGDPGRRERAATGRVGRGAVDEAACRLRLHEATPAHIRARPPPATAAARRTASCPRMVPGPPTSFIARPSISGAALDVTWSPTVKSDVRVPEPTAMGWEGPGGRRLKTSGSVGRGPAPPRTSG